MTELYFSAKNKKKREKKITKDDDDYHDDGWNSCKQFSTKILIKFYYMWNSFDALNCH
jgi:hypothetical protein